jgi:hypothetical protein
VAITPDDKIYRVAIARGRTVVTPGYVASTSVGFALSNSWKDCGVVGEITLEAGGMVNLSSSTLAGAIASVSRAWDVSATVSYQPPPTSLLRFSSPQNPTGSKVVLSGLTWSGDSGDGGWAVKLTNNWQLSGGARFGFYRERLEITPRTIWNEYFDKLLLDLYIRAEREIQRGTLEGSEP